MAQISENRQIKVCVVGCGGIAQISHLPILFAKKDVDIAALCDIDSRKAAILAAKYQIPHVFSDIEEMLSQVQPDAVFILTPNNLHLPMSLLALAAGSHVFLERPAARSSAEATRIARAARHYGKAVMVGMHTRFREDILAIKHHIEKKTLGEMFYIKAEWLHSRTGSLKQPWLTNRNIAGGGVVLDLGLQLIDTTWWLLGCPEITSVKAGATQLDENLNVEDFCSIYLQFDNGVNFTCQISWNTPLPKDRFHAELFASKGYCTLNPFRIHRTQKNRINDLTPRVPHRGSELFRNAYDQEIGHFIEFLQGKKSVLQSGIEDAIKILRVAEAVYHSLRENREIVLPSPQTIS